MAAPIEMSSLYSMIRSNSRGLYLYEIPPRLRNKLHLHHSKPSYEVPPRLLLKKLQQRHPNRPEPSAEPVIEDDVLSAARKQDYGSFSIMKRGQQQQQQEDLPKKTITTTAAVDLRLPKAVEIDQHEVQEREAQKVIITTAEDFPKAAEGDHQNEQEPIKEDDDDELHQAVKEEEKDDEKRRLWDRYFSTRAPALMAPPPPPDALPLPIFLLKH